MFKSSLFSDVTSFSLLSFKGTLSFAVWVKSLHQSTVLKRIGLLSSVQDFISFKCSQFSLDLIRVDNSGEISTIHRVSFELISVLFNTLNAVSSEYLVESFESILSEDNKSSKMTTWSQLEQIQSVDTARIDTWKVTGSSFYLWVFITVDNERSLTENEARVSHFCLSSSCAFVVTDTI